MRVSRFILLLIGFTSVTAQVVLMRELLVLFSGTEVSLGLMLASWLLWTAVGSGFLGRLWTSSLAAVLEMLIAAALPLTILAARACRGVLQTVPGELLSPGVMFATCFVALGPFCAMSGWLFAASSRLYGTESGAPTDRATATAYLLEAAGSAAGGVLASVLPIRYLDALQISWLLALLNLAGAGALLLRVRLRRLAGVGLLVAGLAAFPLFGRLDIASIARLWPGFKLVAVRSSVYGNLTVVGHEGSTTLYENGLPVVTVPDPEAAEEDVHYALLQHPAPKSLLLIGGGINGSLAEALKHPTLRRVDYVELDPAILELADRYFAVAWSPARNDPRVHIHRSDGRLFLKTTGESFDVIIVNLPDPQTAQINRFYTIEFFREAARRLRPGGVFSFRLTSAENYISPELAAFLGCIKKTLESAFPVVTFLPGDNVHFFASNSRHSVGKSAAGLLANLRNRGIRTNYVREYYIPFRMTLDRMADFEAQVRPGAATPINRDFAPIAYYFDAVLWSTRFGPATGRWLERMGEVGFARTLAAAALAALGVLLLLRQFPAPRRHRASAGYAVATMGFTLMGLEILLLMGFQAIYGYVYQQLAILIAMFMAGMAVGGWRGLRTAGNDLHRLAVLQCAAALTPLLLCLFFEIRAGAILFPVLAFLCGLLGGYQFSVASRVFFAGTAGGRHGVGVLYALDLAGSCAGAVLFSAWLIPLFGFWSAALVMAAVCLFSALAPVLPAPAR